MTMIEKVRSAQADVGQMQSTLAAVETGLGTVEVAVEATESARRGLRRLVKVGLLLAVVGVVAAIVLSRRSREPDELSV